MALTLEEIRRVARLARIAVADEEAARIGRDLDGVFTLIEEMQSIDVSGVEPMSHARDIVLRLRPDEVTEDNQRESFQAIAPEVESGLYLVPKVIE